MAAFLTEADADGASSRARAIPGDSIRARPRERRVIWWFGPVLDMAWPLDRTLARSRRPTTRGSRDLPFYPGQPPDLNAPEPERSRENWGSHPNEVRIIRAATPD